MNYTLDVRLTDPPCATCSACGGPIVGIFTVMTKQPVDLTGVVCGLCMATILERPMYLREIQFAITAGETVPELAARFIRYGVFEVPVDHESVCRALGLPLGSVRGIWGDA